MVRSMLLILVLGLPVLGQPARFRSVQQWDGTVTIELTQKGTASMGGLSETYDYKRSARMIVFLDRYNSRAGMWEGIVTGPAEINDTTVVQIGCGVTNTLKKHSLTERISAEFRFEAYNLFNRANFANPVARLNNVLGTGANQLQPGQAYNSTTAGSFGSVLQTVESAVGLGAQRQIQLSLRLNF